MLQSLQCPNCSAVLIKKSVDTYYCEYCGTFVKDTQIAADGATVAGNFKKYSGTDENVIIPYGVKKIEDRAFYNSGVVSVALPDTLEEIGNYAFADCKNLLKIVIPPSVKTIGNRAFFRCFSLEEIELPDDNEIKMGDGVFLGTAVYMNIIKNFNEKSHEKMINERKMQNRCVFCGRPLGNRKICPFCGKNNN